MVFDRHLRATRPEGASRASSDVVDAALIASAALLGLAATPHCAAMCGAPCAAAVGSGGAPAGLAFHLARVCSYAAAGAVAASSLSMLAARSVLSPGLHAVWTLLNAAALVLGFWLVCSGRQPAWLARLGRVPAAQAAPTQVWRVIQVPSRAAAAGALWAAWPCGLLQSALIVAALTSGAASGALAMSGFALSSAPGLLAAPWLWRRLVAAKMAGQGREIWAIRAAGGFLMLASAWALARQLSPQFDAYCRTL